MIAWNTCGKTGMAGILAILAGGALAGPSCIIVSEQGSRVEYAGELVTPPFLAEDCAKVAVRRGSAQACFGTAGGRGVCREVNGAGGAAPPPTLASAETGGLLSAVRGILAGDRQSRIGETRGPGNLDGLPYGAVAMLDGVLELHFEQVDPALDASSFRLWLEGATPALVLELERPRTMVRLTAAQLARGASYHWEFKTPQWTYDGRFATMDAIALAEAGLALLPQPADGSAAWRGAALQGAVRCEAAGLHADARHLLDVVGFRPAAP
jgi:hypothetical protein